MWELLAAITLAPVAPAEEVFMLRAESEPALSIHHEPGPGPSVLYVHGATFPAASSINYRIDGKSWADDLRARGFDVWAFDLAGYGASDRPPPMSLASVPRQEVPGRASDAAHQIERVVRYIRSRTHRPRVSIIAHSWGTIPAGLFTGTHGGWVERLVLFAPIAARHAQLRSASRVAPSKLVSISDQWDSFQVGLPKGEQSLISAEHFETWAAAYLATDADSQRRVPPSVRVPSGPKVDSEDAHSDHFPYDPTIVRVPTLIVRGAWDPISSDADARWLINAMNHVPEGARYVILPRGLHRMHLERNRQILFDAVGRFLEEGSR